MPPDDPKPVGFYFFDGNQWQMVGDAPEVKDPKTEMKEAAKQLHDVYKSLTKAGFSKREALVIVCEILKEGLRK